MDGNALGYIRAAETLLGLVVLAPFADVESDSRIEPPTQIPKIVKLAPRKESAIKARVIAKEAITKKNLQRQ